MSDTVVNVTIGAKIDELITEFQKATQSVTASAQAIGASVDKGMSVVERSADQATAALRRTEQEAAEASSGIGNTMGNIRSMMGNMLGGLLAGFSLRAATDTVVQFADAAEQLGNTAQIINTTATALSRLHASATPLGFAAEDVNKGMTKLARSMSDAMRGGEETAKAFAAVGISADQLKTMSVEQVLATISNRFHDTEDGATKAAVATALMGRSGAELIPWLNQGADAMKEQGDAAEAMGAVMGDDAVAAGAKLDDQLDKLAIQSTGLKNTFAQALAPAIGFIADMFTETSGTGLAFAEVFKVIATIVVGASTIIKAVWEVIRTIVANIALAIISVVDAVAKAAGGDFAGAKAALMQGREMMMNNMTGLIEDLGSLKEKAGKTISEIWGGAGAEPPKKPPATEGGTEQLQFEAKGDGGDGGAADKAAAEAKRKAQEVFEYKMELLRTELSELDRGAQEKIAIAQRMTEMVKAQYGEESREYTRAKREEARITEEVENEKRRISDQVLSAAKERAEREIAIELGKADVLVAAGQMSATERVEMTRRAEEQIYALELSYLEQRLALFANEPQERDRINQEIERLQGEHVLRMQQVDIQTIETNKAQWDQYFNTITDGFANTITGMLFHGQSLRQGMANIFEGIVSQLVSTGVKMLANWIMTQLGMTAATTTGAAVRTAAEVASAKTSVAANAGAGIKNIITKAAEVFASVYNAIAGIPYVGPFLAPVMAVAAGAVVIGMIGKVASAEGGWERVPYDGAMAQLHKEEMVLPAPLAEGLRELVAQGGSRGGVTVNALDRRSVERFFSDNSDMMSRLIRNELNDSLGG